MSWQPIVLGVAKGAFQGALIDGLDYIKREDPETVPFDRLKFIQTVIVGAIVGGAAAYLGVPVTSVEASFAEAGVTVTANWIIKLVYRRLIQKAVA